MQKEHKNTGKVSCEKGNLLGYSNICCLQTMLFKQTISPTYLLLPLPGRDSGMVSGQGHPCQETCSAFFVARWIYAVTLS